MSSQCSRWATVAAAVCVAVTASVVVPAAAVEPPLRPGDDLVIDAQVPPETYLVGNVTSINVTPGRGFVSVFGGRYEGSSTANTSGRDVLANSFVADPGDDGNIAVRIGGSSDRHVVVDSVAELAHNPFTEIFPAPRRVRDTRESGPAVVAGGTIRVALGARYAGRFALINLTVDGNDGRGYLATYPCQDGYRGTSSLNAKGDGGAQAVLNFVKVDANGDICVRSHRAARGLVVDFLGVVESDAQAFERIIDTREEGNALKPGREATVRVGPPNSVFVGTIVSTNPSNRGWVAAYTSSYDGTSTLNSDGVNSVANLVIMRTDANGDIRLRSTPGPFGLSTDIVVDGTIVPELSPYLEADATRLLDTRDRLPLPPSPPAPPPPPGPVCDPNYPLVCVPPPPPILACSDLAGIGVGVPIVVVGSDPHGFDPDGNGIGCETTSGRGEDDLDAVTVSDDVLVDGDPLVVLGDGTGTDCLSGDSPIGNGCVVAQLEPQLTAPAACTSLVGDFVLRVGSSNPTDLQSFSYPFTGSGVPTTLVTDGVHGQSYSWVYVPDSPTAGCPALADATWRTFRIDVVRAGIEQQQVFGPFRVGLSSGSLSLTMQSTRVNLVGGRTGIGLSYRSPGSSQPKIDEPTATLPTGWALTGLAGTPPWVTLRQSGSGAVPAAVVLTAFDGQQVEFTNTLAGTTAVTGAWAPPHQSGWPIGQFGTLVDSGDLTADDAKFTWSNGQEVVVFERTGAGSPTWTIEDSYRVQPGGARAASLDSTWDRKVSPPRLAALTDPVSGKSATFLYADGSTCGGVSPPKDADDTYVAPAGYLCGWSNFDGRTTNVWYSEIVGTNDHQVGWIAEPGEANTQLHWTSDGGRSPAQLFAIQSPMGWDAQGAISTLKESDSTWRVNYDGSGRVASVVSPRPGVETVVPGASTDRVARTIEYKTDAAGVQWATVSHGVLADQDDPTSVVVGASILDEVRYDAAWRPVRFAVETPAGDFYIANRTWDQVHDRPLSTQNFNGRVTVTGYDYLGRTTDRWGPAPADFFVANSDGTAITTATGIDDGDLDHSVSTFDADSEGRLAGFTASIYSGTTIGGVPASTIGTCAEGQCTSVSDGPLTWTELPSDARVTGGDWSINLAASRPAPTDGLGGKLRYRVSTIDPNTNERHGTATIYANGSCTASPTAAVCGTSNTAVTPNSTAAGEPVTLQVQYTRDGSGVSSDRPVIVTIDESTDGGGTWTTLTARDLDPGFGVPSSNSQNDTFSQGGPTETTTNVATFTDPELQHVGANDISSTDGATATTTHTYETYDGTTTWGRTLTMTDPSGSTNAAAYWDPAETATSPCTGATTNQAGLQSGFSFPRTTTGKATGGTIARVYDDAGRPIDQLHTSEDGSETYRACATYEARDQPATQAIDDGSMSRTVTYPWTVANPTNPFVITTTQTTNDSNGSPATYTSSHTMDLVGRIVEHVDEWGVKKTTSYTVDPTTGVRTTSARTVTRNGYEVVHTRTSNTDGTLASTARSDANGTMTASYTYNDPTSNDPLTIDSITITDNGTEIVTETRSYETTNGAHASSAWTRNGVAVADDTLISAPNGQRILGQKLAVNGVEYDWSFSYDGLARLTGAELTSKDGSISGTWEYVFAADPRPAAGENPNAYLNGNITTKTTTLNGVTTSFDYHYDYADRLTRSTDPALASLEYDSFGNLETVGDLRLTYNTPNAPVSVADGKSTVAYTRLIDYRIIEKTTTTPTVTRTIRYSHDGLILGADNAPLLQVTNVGPVIATIPITQGTTEYQLNTITGHRLLNLDATGTPTNSTPTLFDPYGTQINPAPPTTPQTTTPDYGWNAGSTVETETLTTAYTMLGARVYLPHLGRFTSPDPKPGGSTADYGYANADPINYRDPDGFESKSWKAFSNWWKTNFVDFWVDDIPKFFTWAFGKGANGWHGLVGVLAIIAVVVVIIAIVVLVAYASAAVIDILFDWAWGMGEAGVDADLGEGIAAINIPEDPAAPIAAESPIDVAEVGPEGAGEGGNLGGNVGLQQDGVPVGDGPYRPVDVGDVGDMNQFLDALERAGVGDDD